MGKIIMIQSHLKALLKKVNTLKPLKVHTLILLAKIMQKLEFTVISSLTLFHLRYKALQYLQPIHRLLLLLLVRLLISNCLPLSILLKMLKIRATLLQLRILLQIFQKLSIKILMLKTVGMLIAQKVINKERKQLKSLKLIKTQEHHLETK